MFPFSTVSRLFIYCCVISPVCLAQVPGITSPSPDDGSVVKVPTSDGEGVERKVLGPLRIWHIVFLVGLVLIIALTVFCCCIDCRIPRTRQEIEETYRRRQLNQKYLHQLERTPDAVLRGNGAHSSEQGADNEDNDSPRIRSMGRHQPQQQQQQPHHHHDYQQQMQHDHQHHHHQQHTQQQHSHSLNNSQPSRPSQGHSAKQGNGYRHNYHHHHHQDHRHEHVNGAPADGPTTRSVRTGGLAVTESSGRLARIAKSQMYGVQTPFAMSDLTNALQKQGQTRRPQH